MVALANLGAWRGVYDFEASGLTIRERLSRLQYAASRAREERSDPSALEELDFVLSECRALLQLPSLAGECAESERVAQRLQRIQRVVRHYEGGLARLNRRYWWIPCSAGLVALTTCCLQALIAL